MPEVNDNTNTLFCTVFLESQGIRQACLMYRFSLKIPWTVLYCLKFHTGGA